MSRLRKFSDKLLTTVLRDGGPVGACVPEHGTYCGCINHIRTLVNCNGICNDGTGTRC